MKQFTILLVGLTMLVRPLWPVAEYIVNYDYIVNVLCENKDKPQLNCDGKCYLAKQLAKESKQSGENPFGDRHTTEIAQIFQVAPTYSLNTCDSWSYNARTVIGFAPNLNSFLLISKIIQPPEVS